MKHYTTELDSVRNSGLRCLEDINPNFAKSRNLQYYNDSNLIYFRPVTPNGEYRVFSNDIVIAVPKGTARIFNQRERDYRNFTNYIDYSMNSSEYDTMCLQIKQQKGLY